MNDLDYAQRKRFLGFSKKGSSICRDHRRGPLQAQFRGCTMRETETDGARSGERGYIEIEENRIDQRWLTVPRGWLTAPNADEAGRSGLTRGVTMRRQPGESPSRRRAGVETLSRSANMVKETLAKVVAPVINHF